MTSIATYRSSRELFTNLALRELRIEVQAVVPRLGLVAGEPAGHHARLHARLQVLPAYQARSW